MTDDEVGLEPEANGHPLQEERGSERKPLRHERSLPLPFRVKSGQFREEALVLETAHEVSEIPWADVQLVVLGIIEERVEMESAAYQMEKMMGGVSRMIKGGGGRDDSHVSSSRETCFIDLYVAGRSEPFRLDSAHLNYRAFLAGDISYISFQNFFRLAHRLAQKATAARFNDSFVHFLARGRDRVHRFTGVHEFEVDTQNRLQALEKQPGWGDLSFERTSWAEEWVEE